MISLLTSAKDMDKVAGFIIFPWLIISFSGGTGLTNFRKKNCRIMSLWFIHSVNGLV